MSQHQVIAAAYDMKGDNEYLTKTNGLDFGIRMNFYPNHTMRVEELEDERTIAEKIAHERIRKGLKHKVPSILKLNPEELTEDEIGFFTEYLDHEKLDDEILEFWDRLFSEI